MVATTNTTRECCCARSAWCVVASRRCMNGANKSSSPDRLRNCQTTLVSQATHVIAFRDSSRARVSQYSNRQGVVEGLQWPNSSGETDPFSSCRGRFRPRRLRCGGWRRLMFYGLLPRAARAVGRLVAQYRGPASGPSGNKNGPFWDNWSKITIANTRLGNRLKILVRSEFSCDSESGVKRFPNQIDRGPI